jgi:hypothetical protein
LEEIWVISFEQRLYKRLSIFKKRERARGSQCHSHACMKLIRTPPNHIPTQQPNAKIIIIIFRNN